MKAQISLHIYMGSVPCHPHIKRNAMPLRGEQETDEKQRMARREMESDRGAIMKSGKEIKSERKSRRKKMRGQRDSGRTLKEREMGSWDKEVQKTKRRYHSSKEIKDHLHFGFSSAFSVIIPLWRQTPAPTQNDANLEWVILTNWAAGAKRMLFRLRRGAADSGESTAGQRYNPNWLLDSPSPNLRPQGVTAGENGTTSRNWLPQQRNALRPRLSVMTEMLCACVRTIWETHP